jgi:hypothetical protein
MSPSSVAMKRAKPCRMRKAVCRSMARKHLVYYLDEFTFRFNRRKSKSRGKLFYRLVQQAMATEATTYTEITTQSKPLLAQPQLVAAT